MMTRTIRGPSILVLAAATVFGMLAPGSAQEGASGTVEIASTTIAAGIGINWGDGTLTLNDGSKYRFSVENLKVGAVGISSVQAVGKVYNLKGVAEFEGNYVTAEAGLVIGGGASGLTMKNQNGVVINLQSTQAGINITLGPGGMAIKLKR